MILTWSEIESLLSSAARLLLFGPPGTSKTHSATHAPLPENEDGKKPPVFAITVTEETPAAEFRGHFVPTGAGKFGWMDGPALRWWREGGRLIIDEVDKAGADLQSLLLNILNDVKVASLTLPTGETVRPNAKVWRQVIATTNAVPEELAEPLRDRLYPHVLVDSPHPAAFDLVPEKWRGAAKAGLAIPDSDRKIGLREWLTFTQLTQAGVSEVLAAKSIWGGHHKGIITALKLVK